MSVALVPVKHLAAGKSRLADRLHRSDLEALALAMLEDVVTALRATPSVDRVVVTTPDATVAERARTVGAEALVRDDPGLNPAIDAAWEALSVGADEPWLVVLGDVAGARADDFEALFGALAEMGGSGAVLAPSRDGGTSALLRAPHWCVPSRFGVESAKAHREAAADAGVGYRELALPSLALDLDRPDDIEQFLADDAGAGAHTRELLARIWKASS